MSDHGSESPPTVPERAAWSTRPAAHLAAVLTLGVLAYANTFQVPFVFDDTRVIADNEAIRHPGGLLARPALLVVGRPVAFLTFALNYRLHGLDVRGYHATNLLIHLGSAALLYALVLTLFRAPRLRGVATPRAAAHAALLASLLFVAHPLQTQAVTYVVQRMASLCALFCLASVLCYARARQATTRPRAASAYAVALLCFALALMTKPNAMALPMLIALYELLFHDDRLARRLVWLAPLALVAVLPVAAYLVAGTGTATAQLETLARFGALPRGDYLLTQVVVLVSYLRLVVLPAGQNLDHDVVVRRSLLEPGAAAAALALLALLVAVLVLARRSRRQPLLAIVAFGGLWFFAAHVVESGLVVLADVMYEHRMYLPVAGLFAAAAAGVVAFPRVRPRGLRVALGALLVAAPIGLAAATFARNRVWRTDLALWEDAVRKSPRKARPHQNVGAAYARRSDQARALMHLNRALELDPDMAAAHVVLANVYLDRRQLDAAKRHAERAATLADDSAEAWNALGRVHQERGDHPGAVAAFLRAVELKPRLAGVHTNLGNAYLGQGRIDSAVAAHRRAAALQPDLGEARVNLAISLRAAGRLDDAIAEYRAAVTLLPRSPELYYNLGNALAARGAGDEALAAWRRAVDLRPLYAEAHHNLGEMERARGHGDLAIASYRRALEARPGFTRARFGLAQALVASGRRAAARDELRRLLAEEPGNERARALRNELSGAP